MPGVNWHSSPSEFMIPTAGGVTFAHAVNSQALLRQSLADSTINFLEADVMLSASDPAMGVPIMCHPPARESDLTLQDFIAQVRLHNTRPHTIPKGIKLDFKEPRAVPMAVQLLQKEALGGIRDLWMNADIVEGPGGVPSKFDAVEFLRFCRTHTPDARLSLGWTTATTLRSPYYTRTQVDEMLGLCAAEGVRNVTFAVHAFYASRSPAQMRRLINAGHTLTFWGPADAAVLQWALRVDPAKRYMDVRAPTAFEHLWFAAARLMGTES